MSPSTLPRLLANLPWLELATMASLVVGLALGDDFGPDAGLHGRRLCIGTGLVILLLRRRANSQATQVDGVQIAFGAVVLIGLWGLIRATDPLLAGTRLADVCLLALSYKVARGVLLDQRPRDLVCLLTGAGLLAALVGTASLWTTLPGQVDLGGGALGTRNLSAGFCAMTLPTALALRKSPLGLLSIGVVASYLVLSGNRLGLLAGAVGFMAVLLVLGVGKIGAVKGLPTLFAVGLCLAAAGVVSTMPKSGSTSVTERLHLAGVTMDQLPGAGWFGQGPGSWRLTYPLAAAGKDPASWSQRFDRQPNADITLTAARQPAHAHQDFLEFAHEFGLIGLGCLLFLLGRALWPPGRGRRLAAEQLAARGGVLAFGVLAMGFFPLAEPLCLLALGILLALAGPPPAVARSRRGLFYSAPAALAVCALSIIQLGFGRSLAISRQAAESQDFQGGRAALAAMPWSFENERYGAWLESVCMRHESALEHAQAAHRLRPHHPGAQNDLALVLRHFGRDDRAEELLREAHRLVPQDPEVALNLAQILADRIEAADAAPTPAQLVEAARLFHIAVDGNANLVPAWRGLARCASLSGDQAAALRFHEASRAATLRCQIAQRAAAPIP